MPFEGETGEKLRKAVRAVVIMLGVFLFFQTVATFEGLHYIGTGVAAANTIVVGGHGEALAVPDIATFTFSIVSDKPSVAAAQADATAKINAVTAYLKGAGVDEKDIQTSDYNVSPQYEYGTRPCPLYQTQGATYPCGGGTQVLKGYEARQTTTVKVRDTKKAGDLLAGVGSKGASEVSSLQFTFDNPDTVQMQARNKAIANAKQKADVLAKELGVSLVRVVSFSENGNNPGPIYYAKSMESGTAGSTLPPSPNISTGQNKVTSDVSITYEIR